MEHGPAGVDYAAIPHSGLKVGPLAVGITQEIADLSTILRIWIVFVDDVDILGFYLFQ
jgi:hypothetical protein